MAAAGPGQITAMPQQYKIFNDPVHGHIKMHPLLVEIIDTPVFQRLRKIKQMGGIYYVFPGASHNRFEHSLGVGHLAGELIRSLKAHGSEINPIDMFCVQIAGLCHDLGHGPFSHLFEDFLKELSEKMVSATGESETTRALKNWKHEEQSAKMFDLLIEHDIRNKMRSGFYTDDDGRRLSFRRNHFNFIHELIRGRQPTNMPPRDRRQRKPFLFEIVANKDTGIDVDKMDYFSRDCHHLGMKSNFSHERYVIFARVCKTRDGEEHICMRDKEAMNMYELFHNRYMLHYNVCQHRAKVAIETMIVDVLLEAEAYFRIGDKKISEAVMDPKTYLNLTDDILQEIMRSNDENLKTARKIIRRIEKRKLYKFAGSKIFKSNELTHLDTAEKWKTVVRNWLQNTQEYPEWQQWINEKSINEDHFIVKSVKLNYGRDHEDPIQFLWFYRKRHQGRAVKLSRNEVSYTLPQIFADIKVMLFYKGNGKLPRNPPMRRFWQLVENEDLSEVSSEETSEESSEESSEDLSS